MKDFNGVFIIPTGIGCKIGGHAGDATPAAKLIASCCDNLLVNPNVVNASDINEMTDNMWYTEGSILDRFLWGLIDLHYPQANKVLVVANSPIHYGTINAVSAARATIGLKAEIVELETPFTMKATFDSNGCAKGIVEGYKELAEQINDYDFDALAMHTEIDGDSDVMIKYFKSGNGVNPLGGVEALASKLVADLVNKPVAHSPIDTFTEEEDPEMYHIFERVARPELAAEFISNFYLQCILKGLWNAPRICTEKEGPRLKVNDIDFLVSPYGCIGEPHKACLEYDIPVIVVKENTCVLNDKIPEEFIVVDTYWEAAGYIKCMDIGITPESVRRPLTNTKVTRCNNKVETTEKSATKSREFDATNGIIKQDKLKYKKGDIKKTKKVK